MATTVVKTIVVNVKVKNIRPAYNDVQKCVGYNDLREWMMDDKNVYIGRKGVVFIDGERFPKCDSIWANPFKITGDDTRQSVIAKYEKYIRNKIKKEHLYDELEKLRGKRLGCWCKPDACHGDILIKLLNEK